MSDVMHKILQKSQMLDGTAIQIEDWTEVYPNSEKVWMIAAYPLAKNGSYFIKRNEKHRLEISRGFSSNAEVEYIFNGLVDGSLELTDLAEHFRDEKAKYYMGLRDDCPMM